NVYRPPKRTNPLSPIVVRCENQAPSAHRHPTTQTTSTLAAPVRCLLQHSTDAVLCRCGGDSVEVNLEGDEPTLDTDHRRPPDQGGVHGAARMRQGRGGIGQRQFDAPAARERLDRLAAPFRSRHCQRQSHNEPTWSPVLEPPHACPW